MEDVSSRTTCIEKLNPHSEWKDILIWEGSIVCTVKFLLILRLLLCFMLTVTWDDGKERDTCDWQWDEERNVRVKSSPFSYAVINELLNEMYVDALLYVVINDELPIKWFRFVNEVTDIQLSM